MANDPIVAGATAPVEESDFLIVDEDPTTPTASAGAGVAKPDTTQPATDAAEEAVVVGDVDTSTQYTPDQETPLDKVVNKTRDERNQAIREGTREIEVGNLEELALLNLEQMYQVAEKPGAVGKWVSDIIAGRSDDEAAVSTYRDRRREYQGEWAFTANGKVPKSMAPVQIQDSAWVGFTKNALQSVSANFADDIDAWANGRSPEAREEIYAKWERQVDNYAASNPAMAFVAQAGGAVGLTIVTAGAGAAAQGVIRGGAAAANVVQASGTLAKVGAAASNFGKTAALGAAENVVYGVGDRRGSLAERSALDDVLDDAALGAAFGGGAYVGLKGVGAVGSRVRRAWNAMAPTGANTKGVNTDTVSKNLDELLTTVGVDRADLHKAMLDDAAARNQAIAAGSDYAESNMLTLITRLSTDEAKVKDGLAVLYRAAANTGDVDFVRGFLKSNARETAEIAMRDGKSVANKISGGNSALAIKEASERIDFTTASPSDIKKSIKLLTDMLPVSAQEDLYRRLGNDFEILRNPTSRQKLIDELSEEHAKIGAEVGMAAKATVDSKSMNDIETWFDTNLRREVPKGTARPDTNANVAAIESALNSQSMLRGPSDIWEVKIGDRVGNKIDFATKVSSLGDESLESFRRHVLDNNPDIAAKLSIKANPSTGLTEGPAGGFVYLTGADYKTLKSSGAPDLDKLSPFTGKTGLNVDPPELRIENFREAFSRIEKDMVEGKANVSTEDLTVVRSNVDRILRGNNSDYNKALDGYAMVKSGERLTGTGGEKSLINDVLRGNREFSAVEADLKKADPRAVVTAMVNFMDDPILTKYMKTGTRGLDEQEVKRAEALFLRLGQMRKIVDSTFDEVGFVQAATNLRGSVNNTVAMKDALFDALDAPGLKSINDVKRLPADLANGTLSGEAATQRIAQMSEQLDNVITTVDTFKQAIDNSGLNIQSQEYQTALTHLKNQVGTAAKNMEAFVDDGLLKHFYNSLNSIDPADIAKSSKALKNIMNSTEYKKAISTRIKLAAENAASDNMSKGTGGFSGNALVSQGDAIYAKEVSDFIAKSNSQLADIDKLTSISAILKEVGEKVTPDDFKNVNIMLESATRILQLRGSNLGSASGITFGIGEALRVAWKAVGVGNPSMNSAESKMLLDVLSKPPGNSATANRALAKFFGQKPAGMDFGEFLTSKYAQQGLIGLLIAWDES